LSNESSFILNTLYKRSVSCGIDFFSCTHAYTSIYLQIWDAYKTNQAYTHIYSNRLWSLTRKNIHLGID